MHTRRKFIKDIALASVVLTNKDLFASGIFKDNFLSHRPPVGQRKFVSHAVESVIATFKSKVKNPELAWLFENCFPNTLDTTVDYEILDGKPDTYVITGDIDAMWLRDSTAQVWPYLTLMKNDTDLRRLIEGVIRRQTKFIHIDPYANAFYKDPNKVGEWKNDLTEMRPGVHERKWEIDSLCYPIRLAYGYWKISGDASPFDTAWKEGIALTVKTFKEQQRKDGNGPYKFQRTTAWATDGVPIAGYGYPCKKVGLIHSMFRPSDDATIYPFLIPSNFFAVTSLYQAAEMVENLFGDHSLATSCKTLADEVKSALDEYATAHHKHFGEVFAFEVNGYGSHNLMDDANVPSLLSLPYLDAMPADHPIYINTRKYILSEENPFFFKGKAGWGIGGPHTGMDMIWPIGITMRGLTSGDDAEIKSCIVQLIKTHGGTGFMHESFHKDNASNFTRKWFAWANTIFGEFIWKTFRERPHLLDI
ncbi:MAG: glycoside hydrolase family 125 protein [Saprospiraceae bacterium]|nr:glycoside hydrolase family 125 protein [Saprospiraceae bacterium]